MAVIYALVTVFAWGIWLVPSQNVRFGGQQVRTFYVAAANLLAATIVAAALGFNKITPTVFWFPFAGGIVWSLGAWAAFTATEKLGMVKANGTWAPLNIVVSVVLGAVFLHELMTLSAVTTVLLLVSIALIICGILMIVLSKGRGDNEKNRRFSLSGLACAVTAGVLWGAYYLPVKVSHATMWTAAFPLACGMFVGCSAIVLAFRQPLKLPEGNAYVRVASSGLLWALGNYGMLLMVESLGAGRGFTISQLALVVNALCGIYVLRDPEPHTISAKRMLIGCAIATIGAITLGNLK